MSAADPRPPVHVLTGFLGSGKTTLLRHVLRDPAHAGTAVLINELGEIGIDHRLLGLVPGEPVLLENGCICCTVRGDLVAALRTLLADRRAGKIPAFERVVIETSGLSDPTPVVASLLADLVIRRALRPGRVVTTIDALLGGAGLDARPLARKQAAVADVLVLTKLDLARPEAERALRARLCALNPAASILRADHGVLCPRALFTAPSSERDWLGLAEHPVAHTETSFALTPDAPVDYGAFALWFSLLVHRHGARLLRVKALLDVVGSARPLVLHAVQHVIHPPEHLPAWTGPPASALVFVTDGLARAAVARSLAAFLESGREAACPARPPPS